MDCVAHQAPVSMGFSSQEYGIGLPFPTPGDLPVLRCWYSKKGEKKSLLHSFVTCPGNLASFKQ